MEAKDEIADIVQWLEDENEDEDEDQWEDQIDTADEALAALRRISTPPPRRDKTGTRSAEMPTFSEESKQAGLVVQQVNAMIVAMRRKDRKVAAAYGRAALALL